MQENANILLVYDKECPACHSYCQLAEIRETVGKLTLIDARNDSEIMDEITDAGLDIDQGIVLKIGEELYHGTDAIQMLSMLSTRTGVFNRLTYHVFRSRRVAKVLYPILRTLRNILLKFLRKAKTNNLAVNGNEQL